VGGLVSDDTSSVLGRVCGTLHVVNNPLSGLSSGLIDLQVTKRRMLGEDLRWNRVRSFLEVTSSALLLGR
jgi:hypothetical protein